MKTYKIVNNLVGWLIFAIAAFTYCSTIEPTASFWDCPEFITTAYKFEVGHPPGAPFFMMVGKFFTLFADDPTQVAKMVNTMSALLSAGCILFLFWTITHLSRKLIVRGEREMTVANIIAIMACGVCGSLIYTWSDTFWFSAVEGEVYAFSSFFTALVFWLILKWEDNADKPHSDRWIVLLAYLVGLSIGVHLLNLLCIPAIVLVFYYRKYKNPTLKGSLIALLVSVVVIIAVLYGIVPGVLKVGGWFELLFVNTFGCPFNTGLYIYLTILAASLIWGIYESSREGVAGRTRMNIAFLLSTALLGIPFYGHGTASIVIGIIVLAVLAFVLFNIRQVSKRIVNTALLCMMLIMIGFSTYAVIVIRSTANPPMDQNSPEDVFTLGNYLGREQYGQKPLLIGPAYNSKPEVVMGDNGYMYATKIGAPVYQRKDKANPDEKDQYIKIRNDIEYVYPMNQQMLFPRLFDSGHAADYERWLGGVEGKYVDYDVAGRITQVKMPTQWDNLKYFLSYQVNFMYWRYFMWNFAGRQNDIQGNGELEHGNWITGIPVIDNLRLGDQSKLPEDLRTNKGHNVFYCLPLLLGVIGLIWQAYRGQKGIQQFWVVFFLFFMTGLAIILYLNQTPREPRERDYAYAGSFYAFAIWCGLGIAAIYGWMKKLLKAKDSNCASAKLAAVIAFVPAVAVPLQMVSQTWDDHDRSNRYMCRDFGLNYLETIPHDGIIFTNGDNDTFPLWYNEDTEGNRTDVRVCNLSYLQTDWYIDQMKRPAYEGEGQSSPLPISWNRLQYTAGKNEIVEVNPQLPSGDGQTIKDFILEQYRTNPEEARKLFGDEPFELTNVMKNFVLNEQLDPMFRCIPSDTVYVKVDKEAVRKSGMMIPGDSIPDRMAISLSGTRSLYKNQLMMLEMLAQSQFRRPIYMSTTVGASNYGNLYKHFVMEGLAYRITPFTFDGNSQMSTVVDSEIMYDNMMNKYKYGNLKQKGLYVDETSMRMCYTHRRWFSELITKLLEEGKKDKAKKALEKCATEIPDYNVPHDVGCGSLSLATAYVECGMPEKGEAIFNALEKKAIEYANWYLGLSNRRFSYSVDECIRQMNILELIWRNYSKMANEKQENGQPLMGKKAEAYAKKAAEMENTLNSLYMKLQSKASQAGISLQ